MEGAGEEKELAIGIDLGTTYSCVGVWQHDRVEILTNDLGSRTTPSWVAFDQHQCLIGEAALNQASRNPANTIFDAKRLIGRRFSDKIVQKDIKLWPFKVLSCPTKDDKPMIVVTYNGDKKTFFAEEISSMVLIKMKETAEAKLGRKVQDAVITVPAYFNDSQRQATKEAGIIAGLNVMRIINEPTAAAIAYGLEKKVGDSNVVKRNVLVFDLGGGTFDVSLVTMDKDHFEVKAVSGDTHLGGGDFDNRLVSYFVAEFKWKHNQDISGNPRSLGRLRTACERAKRILSVSATVETPIEIDCLYKDIDFYSVISRARFERLNMDLFQKCLQPVEECLNDAKMGKGEIDDIVLVGGSTRIPKVQTLLQDFFNGKELCKSLDEDEAVAQGAAIHAAVLSGVRHKQHLMLVDVAPLSLGVQIVSGELKVVIRKNTQIPAKMDQEFTTTHDKQTVVRIFVYEGERTIAIENNCLGSFDLGGIAPAPKGSPKIIVSFEIDVNGILTVTAKDKRSGNTSQITITKHSGTDSKMEIDRMFEEARNYMTTTDINPNKESAKVNLENYVNYIKGFLSQDFAKIMEIQEMKKLDDAVRRTAQWLLWNCDLTNNRKFEEKLEELKTIFKDVTANAY